MTAKFEAAAVFLRQQITTEHPRRALDRLFWPRFGKLVRSEPRAPGQHMRSTRGGTLAMCPPEHASTAPSAVGYLLIFLRSFLTPVPSRETPICPSEDGNAVPNKGEVRGRLRMAVTEHRRLPPNRPVSPSKPEPPSVHAAFGRVHLGRNRCRVLWLSSRGGPHDARQVLRSSVDCTMLSFVCFGEGGPWNDPGSGRNDGGTTYSRYPASRWWSWSWNVTSTVPLAGTELFGLGRVSWMWLALLRRECYAAKHLCRQVVDCQDDLPLSPVLRFVQHMTNGRLLRRCGCGAQGNPSRVLQPLDCEEELPRKSCL